MSHTVIENPVINSSYLEPFRHFRFTDEGITNAIVTGRRVSSYFIPIPQPKQKTKQIFKRHRLNEVVFQLAKRVYEQKFPDKKTGDQPWLFPQVLSIMAQVLEEMDEVVHYVKNQSRGFTIPYTIIPYTINRQEHQYNPDFILGIDDRHGPDVLLSLILEVSGQQRLDKDVKVSTARELRVPVVNNHGGFGRWGFIEMTDPWDAAHAI